VGPTLALLAPRLEGKLERGSALLSIRGEILARVTDRATESRFPLTPQRIVHDVRQVMPEDGIVCLDNGMYKLWFARYYACRQPNTLLLDNALATMGAGLPSAIAAKLVYPRRKVLAVGGDGDGYGIGIQHFLHSMRRNLDLTYIVMDNQTYGLTKGQSSPTSAVGYVTGTSPTGNPDAPINGLGVALAAGGTFLARGFSSQPKAMVELIKAAVLHPGFSIVEVMSPCVTFNKVNTYAWFKENVYQVTDEPGYDNTNRTQAFEVLMRAGKIPLGILYQEQRPTLEELSHLPEQPIAKLRIENAPAAAYTAIQSAYR